MTFSAPAIYTSFSLIKQRNLFDDSSLFSKAGHEVKFASVLCLKKSSSWIALIHLSFVEYYNPKGFLKIPEKY